jgi:hypothetical protein
MKPRSDSRLFQLSTDQQAQLYHWIHKLGYAKARELAALPPPDGFGIKTHLNSLCRFVARYSEMQKEREFYDILRCALAQLGHAWTKIEYDRLALQEKLAALRSARSARAVPPSENFLNPA